MQYAICVVVADHIDEAELNFTQKRPFDFDFTYHNFINIHKVGKCSYISRISAQGSYVWCDVIVLFNICIYEEQKGIFKYV